MWVGTSNGLNRYDEESNKFINYYANDTNKSINNNYITDIEEDDLGYLWVSTIEGTVAIKLNTYEIFNEKNESNLKYIYQMDKDFVSNVKKGDIIVSGGAEAAICACGVGGFKLL